MIDKFNVLNHVAAIAPKAMMHGGALSAVRAWWVSMGENSLSIGSSAAAVGGLVSVVGLILSHLNNKRLMRERIESSKRMEIEQAESNRKRNQELKDYHAKMLARSADVGQQ